MIPRANKWYSQMVNWRELNTGIINKDVNGLKESTMGVEEPGPGCTASLDYLEDWWGMKQEQYWQTWQWLERWERDHSRVAVIFGIGRGWRKRVIAKTTVRQWWNEVRGYLSVIPPLHFVSLSPIANPTRSQRAREHK